MPTADAPVRPADRIASIDVLRGVAVLGILLLNVNDFSMVRAAYLAPTLGVGPFEGANFAAWATIRAFGDQRFMSIFTMLFGAGVVLSTTRADAAAAAERTADGLSPATTLHLRRMAGLLAIGLAHAYLLWPGDVLVCYAILGAAVFPLRRRPAVGLLMMGAGLILLGGLLAHASSAAAAGEVAEVVPAVAPDVADAETRTMRGPWAGQFRLRAAHAFESQVFAVVIYGPRVAGLMLVGMGLLKLGLLDARAAGRRSLVLATVGLGVGLPLAALDLHLWRQNGYATSWAYGGALAVNYWASAFAALGYVGLIVPASRALPALITRPMAAVGRAALSNYLLQTLAGLAVFNGVGLGLFGRVDRVGQLGFVLAVWAVQVPLSVAWLRRFRFGPVEWAWRSATYGAFQPMRR